MDTRTVYRRSLPRKDRIRVLVVDDSVVIRRLVTLALQQDPAIEVVGSAPNGALALDRIPQLQPDLLTLDIEMPVMDGLETLRRLRASNSTLRVIMFSTLTERGAAVTFEALSLGADDYVTKPSNEGSLDRSLERLHDELIPKIKQFFTLPGDSEVSVSAPSTTLASPLHLSAASSKPKVVVIGCSTGGPAALDNLLPRFPAGFPLPVLVVQHMPAVFTRLLAERLNSKCRLPVCEAKDGEPVIGGKIFIAPGDFHMRVADGGGKIHVHLDQSPPQNFCRPAVDALFTSIADVYGSATVAIILTGMGQDGLRGAESLKKLGATILAQDRQSSVVWGMPGAVTNAGLADSVLPLDQCASQILRLACPA
jgi:two-component system chemotaxis response regulator CheB